MKSYGYTITTVFFLHNIHVHVVLYFRNLSLISHQSQKTLSDMKAVMTVMMALEGRIQWMKVMRVAARKAAMCHMKVF